jgi:prepilin-type N-terminal cleavage/methylation domain-containing protein
MNMIQKRQQMKGQSGFTLIELLVAVAILGVLAGVAVFAVGGLTGQSKVSACKTEAETLRTAVAASNASELTTDVYTTFAKGTPKYFTAAASGTGNAVTVIFTRIGAAQPFDPPGDATPLVTTDCNSFTAAP